MSKVDGDEREEERGEGANETRREAEEGGGARAGRRAGGRSVTMPAKGGARGCRHTTIPLL